MNLIQKCSNLIEKSENKLQITRIVNEVVDPNHKISFLKNQQNKFKV